MKYKVTISRTEEIEADNEEEAREHARNCLLADLGVVIDNLTIVTEKI